MPYWNVCGKSLDRNVFGVKFVRQISYKGKLSHKENYVCAEIWRTQKICMCAKNYA